MIAAGVEKATKMPSLEDFIEDNIGYLENKLEEASDNEPDVIDKPSE